MTVTDWQLAMTRHLRNMGVDEGVWLNVMSMNVTGAAAQWLSVQELRMANSQRAPFRDWQQFLQELRTLFEPTVAADDARRELKRIRQTTSVRDFVTRFRKLVLRVPDMSLDDQYLIFVDGLKEAIRLPVATAANRDIEQAIILAERIDSLKPTASTPSTPKFWRKKKGSGKPRQNLNAIDHRQKYGGGKRYHQKPNQGKSHGFQGKCYLCDQSGHGFRNCPKLGKAKKSVN
ncbi:MAG: hypothetical protein Pars2KO_33330 [Parasphingorhabdus sp.]